MFKLNFPNVEVSRLCNKPCSRIWEVLTDTSLWPLWGPSVKAVECNECYIRKGTRGRVNTTAGIWVPFIVCGYEQGRFWSWKIAGIPATGHRVEPLKDGLCLLTFEIPLVAAPYAYICKIALGRIAGILA